MFKHLIVKVLTWSFFLYKLPLMRKITTKLRSVEWLKNICIETYNSHNPNFSVRRLISFLWWIDKIYVEIKYLKLYNGVWQNLQHNDLWSSLGKTQWIIHFEDVDMDFHILFMNKYRSPPSSFHSTLSTSFNTIFSLTRCWKDPVLKIQQLFLFIIVIA